MDTCVQSGTSFDEEGVEPSRERCGRVGRVVSPSSFHSRRSSDSARTELLESIVVACGSVERPVVVFDLDGTLLDNRPRVTRIFHELAEFWSIRHPDAAEKCARVRDEHIVYGVIDNLVRAGVDDETLHQEGLKFWRDRFFYDAYIRYDVEVPGARSFVRACFEAGASIVYLTGRDLPNMALGTLASLRDLDFPIGVVGTSLVLKPAFEVADSEFKNAVAPSIARIGKVVASFDNEPANCNLFLEHHPEARSVLLDTHHAPNPPPLDARAAVIDSFLRHG